MRKYRPFNVNLVQTKPLISKLRMDMRCDNDHHKFTVMVLLYILYMSRSSAGDNMEQHLNGGKISNMASFSVLSCLPAGN